MKKSQRHAAILDLISRKTVRTQEELLSELKAMGFDTTQATVSRDIRDLKIVKTSDNGGYQYSSVSANADGDFSLKLKTIFTEAVYKVDCACNIVVLKTYPGMGSAAGVAVAVRDNALCCREFSARMPRPTQSAIVIAEEAFKLYRARYDRARPLRSITVRAIDLAPKDAPRQLDIFEPSEKEDKTIRLCEAMDDIREKFGRHAIVPANSLTRERVKDFGFGAIPSLAAVHLS